MSSVITTSFRWSATRPSARSSSAEYAAPVGLLGLFRITATLRGPSAASSSAGAMRKPRAAVVVTMRGTAPASTSISG